MCILLCFFPWRLKFRCGRVGLHLTHRVSAGRNSLSFPIWKRAPHSHTRLKLKCPQIEMSNQLPLGTFNSMAVNSLALQAGQADPFAPSSASLSAWYPLSTNAFDIDDYYHDIAYGSRIHTLIFTYRILPLPSYYRHVARPTGGRPGQQSWTLHASTRRQSIS